MIGVSGESGVGKSTIAEIISLFFDSQTLIISTDDLHKWSRPSKNWEVFTHLNPDANNIELGDIHLASLSKKESIYRSKYNHQTGYFDPPIKIEPQDVIIVEGLHAFYSEISKNLLDLKIFIDTDEDLRVHWKILRDTEERGYKYNVVLDAINKRKPDSKIIRDAQITTADAVIKISPKQKITCLGDKYEKIKLDVSISFGKNHIYKDLFEFIQSYIAKYNTFVELSEAIGNDIEMCQDGGGNISTKISNKYMIIKSSGCYLKDVNNNGYSILNYQTVLDVLNTKSEILFNKAIADSLISNKYKRPSMETGFHAVLDTSVIHVHPIYPTLLLCMDNSQNIIQELYGDLNYKYIKYISPGLPLSKSIRSLGKADIYFLENHGVVLSSIDLLYKIHNTAKQYIIDNCKCYEDFDINFSERKSEHHYAFPDAVIFANDITKKETIAAHNYINTIGAGLGKIRHLNSHQIQHLQNLEAEKYRKNA